MCLRNQGGPVGHFHAYDVFQNHADNQDYQEDTGDRRGNGEEFQCGIDALLTFWVYLLRASHFKEKSFSVVKVWWKLLISKL